MIDLRQIDRAIEQCLQDGSIPNGRYALVIWGPPDSSKALVASNAIHAEIVEAMFANGIKIVRGSDGVLIDAELEGHA